MKQAFDAILLTIVDRLSNRLGPLTALADRMVELIAPKAIAQANCYFCRSTCDITQCGNHDKGVYIEYYYTGLYCAGTQCNKINYGCQYC